MKALFLTLAAATLVVFLSNAGETDIKEGTVLYFAFDEGKGETVKDLSGNDNDGEIKGAAKWVDGKFGKALEFDGKTGYVEVPDSESLDFEEASTIEAWVKSNADNTVYTDLVRKGLHGSNKPNHLMLQVKPDGPGGVDLIQVVYSHASKVNDYVNSTTSLDVGKWYHLAAVVDPPSGKMIAYFNGELDVEKEIPDECLQPDDNLLFVGRGNQGYFNGIMDEVVIYNRALTADEIKQDMAGIKMTVSPAGKLATIWGKLKKVM